MFDKSMDYLLQDSPISVWYLGKTAEGDPTFNTNSVAVFKDAATQIDFAVREETHRTEMLEQETGVFHLWRAVCPTDFAPTLSDKLYDGQYFWLVEGIDYNDRDDSQLYQRFTLTVRRSKLTVVP